METVLTQKGHHLFFFYLNIFSKSMWRIRNSHHWLLQWTPFVFVLDSHFIGYSEHCKILCPNVGRLFYKTALLYILFVFQKPSFQSLKKEGIELVTKIMKSCIVAFLKWSSTFFFICHGSKFQMRGRKLKNQKLKNKSLHRISSSVESLRCEQRDGHLMQWVKPCLKCPDFRWE